VNFGQLLSPPSPVLERKPKGVSGFGGGLDVHLAIQPSVLSTYRIEYTLRLSVSQIIDSDPTFVKV